MTEAPIRLSMPPIIPEQPRVLVLGSMPGEQSIAAQQYYAYQRNQFWRILAAIFGEPLPEAWAERVALLGRHSIALWDVAHSCRRHGSLDSAITDVEPNDVAGLLAAHPTIGLIALNGGKAAELFRRHIQLPPDLAARLRIITVPSTSPANTQRWELKRDAWAVIAGGAAGAVHE